MVKVESFVEEVKNGNNENYEFLYDYYKKRFLNIVESKYGKDYKNQAEIDYDSIFNDYFKRDFKIKLSLYIYRRAVIMYGPKDAKKTLQSKISDRNTNDIASLTEHYMKKLKKNVKVDYQKFISDDEFDKLLYDILYDYMKHVGLNTNPKTVLSMICAKITREEEYLCDEETFLKKYIMHEGTNEKINTYITNKYLYLLEKYRYTKYYNVLCYNFEEIVEEALDSIKKTQNNFEKQIKEAINQKRVDLKNRIQTLSKDKNLTLSEKKELYYSHEFIKEVVYKKHKDRFKDIDIKEDIIKRYDDYFKAYVNGVAKRDLGSYLLIRYNEYFGYKYDSLYVKPVNISKEEFDTKVDEYYYIYQKSLAKFSGYYNADKILEDAYLKLMEKYFQKHRRTPIEYYLNNSLYVIIKELNAKYNDDYLDTIINSIKDKNLIPNDIEDEYFDGLKQYYIDNALYRKIPFEKYLYDEVNNFNHNEYLSIKEVKNCDDKRLCYKGKTRR